MGTGAVFLDSISRGGAGSLVQDDTANSIIDALNSISPTWFAIAHTPRDNGGHVFGNQHFDAGADVLLKLSSEQRGSTLGIGLEITAANDIPKQPRQYLALEFDDAELPELVAVRGAREAEFPELAGNRTMKPVERVVAYLQKIGAATGSQVASETGLDNSAVSRIFQADMFTVDRRDGHKVFYRLREERL
jgi:hypothetical protein